MHCHCKTISKLSVIIIYLTVLAILKKNYTRLCKCLPQDCKKTVQTLKQMYGGSAYILDSALTFGSTEVINEAIMCPIFAGIRTENDVFTFCEVMKKIVDSPSSQQFIDDLQHGTYIMYVYVYVHC